MSNLIFMPKSDLHPTEVVHSLDNSDNNHSKNTIVGSPNTVLFDNPTRYLFNYIFRTKS